MAAKKRRSKRIAWNKDDTTIHFEGILGEYAVHKLFWLPFDPDPLPGGDQKIDMTLPTGETVQVKYRSQRGWDFLLPTDKPEDFVADIGILVYPANDDKLNDDVEIVGWVGRDTFIEQATTVNYINKPNGKRLALSQDKFLPITDLLKRVLVGVDDV